MNKQSGMTLVELVISLAVMGIVVLGATNAMMLMLERQVALNKRQEKNAELSLLEFSLKSPGQSKLYGRVYINQAILNRLNFGWINWSQPTDVAGSILSVPNKELNMASDQLQGITNSSVNSAVLVMQVGVISDITTAPVGANNPQIFANDPSTGTLALNNPSGNLAQISGEQYFLLMTDNGSMILQATAWGGNSATTSVQFRSFGQYRVGPTVRKLPLSVIPPGSRIAPLRPLLLGVDSNSKKMLVLECKNGNCTTKNKIDMKIASFVSSHVTLGDQQVSTGQPLEGKIRISMLEDVSEINTVPLLSKKPIDLQVGL